MPDRKIVYLPLAEIVGATRNPKDHDLDRLAASVGRFSFTEPLLRDDRTGRLVAGHGRVQTLTAMRERGEDPPDGIRADWAVPVVTGWASRSDAEADALLVASNRLTETGGWDSASLADLLADLAAADPDLLPVTGYDRTDLDRLLAEVAARPDPTAPEQFPEYDENIETAYTCPRCSYSWSGQPTPPGVAPEDQPVGAD